MKYTPSLLEMVPNIKTIICSGLVFCPVPASEDEESWKKIRSFLALESISDCKVFNSFRAAIENCLFLSWVKLKFFQIFFFNKKIVWLCRWSRQQKWILNNYSDKLEILCSLRLWQLKHTHNLIFFKSIFYCMKATDIILLPKIIPLWFKNYSCLVSPERYRYLRLYIYL